MSSDALPTLTGAFAWWVDELKGLVTPRRRTSAVPAGLVLELAGDAVRIAALPRDLEALKDKLGGEAQPLDDTQALGDAVSVPLAVNYLRARAGAGRALPPVILRIKAPGFLKREVLLPSAAERNFAHLLALDLKRATPFKREDVYAGFDSALAKDSTAGLTPVTQYVVKRAPVDEAVRGLGEEGLSVVRIECLDESLSPSRAISVTLAGDDIAAAAPRRGRLLPAFLAALLAVSATAILVSRYEAVLESVRGELAAVQKDASAARAALQGTEAEAQSFRTLVAMQSALKSRAAILETLTRLMPDTAYVTELRIDGPSIEITGLAASASALLPLIENSDLFVDARMSMPQMLDPLTKKERFGIKMRLRGVEAQKVSPAAGEGAP